MKKVTMQDIADRLGITKVSVSKALNGQPGISAQTRARILEAAVQMGYAGKARETGRPGGRRPGRRHSPPPPG